MAQLITVDEFKRYHGIAGTSDDTLLQELIDEVSDFVEAYCQRSFALATYQEKYDIHFEWQNEISLRHYPALTVSWVAAAGVSLDASTWYVDLDAGIIKLAYDTRFPRGREQVEVLYRAGYSSTPPLIRKAVRRLVAIEYGIRKSPELESAKLGDYSFKRARTNELGLPRDVQLILDQFVRLDL
jgi:hypothetical protein